MKITATHIKQAADTIIRGLEAFNVFTFRLLTRVSEPLVGLGLIYWVTARLGHLTVPFWWNPAWALVQAIAITAHLVTLPNQAIRQAGAGEKIKMVGTIIVIALLAGTTIPLITGLDTPALVYIRILALASILFTNLLAERKDDAWTGGIPTNGEEDEYPFSSIRAQEQD